MASRARRCAATARWLVAAASLACASTEAGAQGADAAPDAKPPVRAEDKPGPLKTETISFEHWTLVCEERLGAGGAKVCVGRLPVSKDNRQLIAVVSLFADKAGALQIEVRTPTSLLLAPGVKVAIADAAQRLTFASCDPASCLARGAADETTLKGLREEQDARVLFTTTKPENYVVKFPTAGARRILDALGAKASAQR